MCTRRIEGAGAERLAARGLTIRVVRMVVGLMMAVLIAATSARAGTWNVDTLPAPGVQSQRNASGDLKDVSCPSVSFCAALGDDYSQSVPRILDLSDQNGMWTTAPGPGNAQYLSCSSPAFCMAVGDVHAAVWSGSSWTSTAGPPRRGDTFFEASSVSCSGTTCAAAGDLSQSEAPAAELWRDGTLATIAAPIPELSPNSVSCVAATRCVIVGTHLDGPGPFAESWNGRTWRAMKAPQAKGYAGAGVSCLSATWCLSVSSDGRSARWNGRQWSLLSQLTYRREALGYHAVSCAATTSCEAVGWTHKPGQPSGDVFAIASHWDGHSWSNEPVPDDGYFASQLNSVACPSPSLCTAVGILYRDGNSVPLAESWQPG
jgi:hypothetical protein